jgi:hypothetical protein
MGDVTVPCCCSLVSKRGPESVASAKEFGKILFACEEQLLNCIELFVMGRTVLQH